MQSGKIKIALIPDEENWAFGNIAKQIKKHLNDYFDFKIVPFRDYLNNLRQFHREVKYCDILHFFWRDTINNVLPIYSPKFQCGEYKNKIISTAVYDHFFLSKKEIIERRDLFNKTSYYVCSERLKQIYNDIRIYKKPIMVIEDGVDPDLFYPINRYRLRDKEKAPLVIGWVGNSQWQLPYDLKGLKTFIKPAVKQLSESGYSIQGIYCDRNKGYIPHNEMVNYYSKIDILVCMSKTEGTPNPVLEAMACGVPIISTDVGIIPQVFGKKQKEFILEDLSIESLINSILKLYNNRNILWELSEENLKQIRNWYWSKQCLKFKSYFEELAHNLRR